MTNPTLDTALNYAVSGLPVIPVKPRSKVPAISRWTERATTDPDIITEWCTDPDTNIGIATGHPYDGGYLIVIDIDEHDPAHSGEEALRDLEAELGELSDTYTVLTPTGGRHIYGITWKPLTNAAGSNLPQGIDIRGAGGYVLAPPSIHPDGGTYEVDLEHDLDNGIAWLPAAWVERLSADTRTDHTATTPHTQPTAARGVFGGDQDRPGDIWAAQTTWAQLLEADGWTHAGTSREGHDEWTRPGKTVREGISATTGYGTADVLKVFTSSAAPLEAEQTYTKLGYYTTVHHRGDYNAAVDHLRTLGHGAQNRTASGTDSTPSPAVYQSVDPATEWETPLDLNDTDRPPFPLHTLPTAIANQAHQAAVEMQLAPDLAAQLAITALSIITAGRVDVQVDGRHREPCHLYNVTALPPSAGKSPTFAMMLGALDRWEEELVDLSAEQIDDRNIARKMAEKERDDAIKQGDATRAKIAADDLRDRYPVINTPRLMADDATPEKLVELLDQQNGRIALVSTEGGLFGMMTGRYSDKSNLDVYLGAWSGDTIRVDRIERGSTVVRRPALTVGLTVQPSVLADVGRNRELVGRGLTTRFMYSLPADTVGRRDLTRDSNYSDTVETHYSDQLLAIARRLDDRDTTLTLTLTPPARHRFKQWQAHREIELGPYSSLRYMAEWVGKCNSSVARLAGLLHLTSGDLSTNIDEHTIEAAIEVGDYWTAHAKAVFDLMGASDDLGHARYILGWLETRTDTPGDLTFRDIHQHTKKRVTRAEDVIPAVELLVEHGWLRPAFDGPIAGHVGRGRTSPTFHVHPSLTVPHIPHINAQGDNETTTRGNVREVREVSHRGTLRTNIYQSESQDERTPKPGLTSLTSLEDTIPAPITTPNLGPFG